MSAGLLQQIGALGVSIATAGTSPEAQALIMLAYGVGTNVGAALPFSRQHEHEADEYGLYLMAIAGYDPNEAAAFWERMSAAGGGSVPEFLSTHPSDVNRIRNLRNNVPEAKRRAASFGVFF
jgi:predicted Zn-dependent protease